MPTSGDSIETAIQALRLTAQTMPPRWSEDTVDELLRLVHLTFGEFIVAVLEEPLPKGLPAEGRPPLVVIAALHGRAIADLLAALALRYGQDGVESVDAPAEARQTLIEHWLERIVEAVWGEERPRHDTAVDYVRGAAMSLNFVTRILGVEQGLSLDPDDPRGPIEQPDDSLTSEDAGGLLVWCAAAALCIAAKLQPAVRLSR